MKNWILAGVLAVLAIAVQAQTTCVDPLACNFTELGECEFLDDNGMPCVTEGCAIPGACNFNPEADINDGSCEFTSCLGCTDEAACNYDPEAVYLDLSCIYFVDCNGVCGGDWIEDECGNCYSGEQVSELEEVLEFEFSGGVDSFTAPYDAIVVISAGGAQGGGNGGFGAIVGGEFSLSQGESIDILVGQQGGAGASNTGNGGGGGTYVVLSANPLVSPLLIAGGGGGSGHNNYNEYPQIHGQTGLDGAPGADAGENGSGGNGGEDGAGGLIGRAGEGLPNSGGGGGFYGSGESDANAKGGNAYTAGGEGGGSSGGFGGGGGGINFYYACNGGYIMGGGGGGGYSGGGGGGGNCNGPGGGGGSFNASENPMEPLSGASGNSGNGFVRIELYPPVAPSCQLGCTFAQACNFNPEATNDDGSCDFCFCGPGTEYDLEFGQCMIVNGSPDINGDGCTNLNDLLDLLSGYGTCED